MIDVYTKDYTIGFSHIDRGGRISPFALFTLFDECAVAHAESLGLGYTPMLEQGAAWVLSRISLRMEERPKRCDAVTVNTWPRGADRLFVVRDYELNSGGKQLARARSDWLILDLEKRRPLRPQIVLDKLPANEGRNVMTEAPIALSEARQIAPGSFVKAANRKALYSDLDFNGHVNYMRYVQWVSDLFEPARLENAASFSLDLNYLREITASSETEIWTAEKDGSLLIEGRQEGDVMFRARASLG